MASKSLFKPAGGYTSFNEHNDIWYLWFQTKIIKNAEIVLLTSAAGARVAWAQAKAPRTAGSCNKFRVKHSLIQPKVESGYV